MSTDRISIFNYEAFYLDYLEGNLGEEDTALLLAFLEEHPELVEEEEDFVLLDPKEDTPVFEDKDSLKVVNDDAVITLSNAEHFLIADSEGQLPATKQEELDALVAKHPHLEKERKYLAAMFLKADESIVYANKAGLKRKGAVVFWPYIALAAASVLIAFFFVMNNNSEVDQIANEKLNDKKTEELKNEAPIIEQENLEIADNTNVETESENVGELEDRKIERSNEPTDQSQRPDLASVNQLEYKRARRVINSFENQNLNPVSNQIDPVAVGQSPEKDYALANAESDNYQMKNPIKPITSRLEKTLKTDVDFQTSKAASRTGGGFYLKIGKFELSRKKGKK